MKIFKTEIIAIILVQVYQSHSNQVNIANLKISKYGSSQIDIGLSGHKKEGKTYATIGQGTINISDGSDISSLNRDMTQTEKTTKDINTGGLDVSLTLDHTLLRGDFDKLGKDLDDTGINMQTIADDLPDGYSSDNELVNKKNRPRSRGHPLKEILYIILCNCFLPIMKNRGYFLILEF